MPRIAAPKVELSPAPEREPSAVIAILLEESFEPEEGATAPLSVKVSSSIPTNHWSDCPPVAESIVSPVVLAAEAEAV
ncbi:MAG: hypothetical protein ACE5G9_02735 [Nitrospinales bacterium]